METPLFPSRRLTDEEVIARWDRELRDLEKRSKLPKEEQDRRTIVASPIVRGLNELRGKVWDEDKGRYVDVCAIRQAEESIRKAEADLAAQKAALAKLRE
jgi:hypothetical protein